MFKKLLPRALIALIFLSVALLLTAPAQVVERQLSSQIPGVSTEGTEGRLWSGKFARVSYQQLSVHQVGWSLSAGSLLTAKAGATITIDDVLFKGSLFVQQSLGGTSNLSDINGRQSLDALSDVLPILRFIKPSGDAIWQDVSLSFDASNYHTASGTVTWPDAILTANGQSYVLGEMMIELSAEDGKLILSLSSDQQLDLSGSIALDRKQHYDLEVSVREDLPENLYNAIRMMARPDGAGRLTFNRSGN